MNRKNFIQSTALIAGVSAVANPFVTSALSQNNPSQKIALKKGLGYAMIKEELSLTDKFKLVKDLGFDGMELNAPTDLDRSEILEAKEKAGIEIPSLVNKDHWQKPLSDPDPKVRLDNCRSEWWRPKPIERHLGTNG